jgi:hypothetical protein
VAYFLLTYDQLSLRVLAFTSHGSDFIGAVLALVAQLDRHRGETSVAVKLYDAASLEELSRNHSDLFTRLKLPAG